MRTSTILIAGTLLVAAGCQRPSPAEPASYRSHLNENLEADRADFINKSNQRLGEIDRQINLVKAKIGAESPYVSEQQRADWKQQLFDLRMERTKLDAEVKRAEQVPLSEWKSMRGNLGVALDSLEAAVQQMSYEVRTAFGR